MAKSSETTASSEGNPNLRFGSGEFEMPNGDKYVGEYCAHRYGLIWREGHGTYITKDGQTYEGNWRDDKLLEQNPLLIKFPSGEEYHGPLLQEKYSGGGTYTMDNRMDISCEFADSKPIGTVVLIDVNGRLWEGKAGENKALLLPENEFFLSITSNQGVGEPKKQEKGSSVATQESVSSEKELSDRMCEKLIFAKGSRIPYNVDLTESKWYHRYLRFVTMKNTIAQKMETCEILTEEEIKWKSKYKTYKEKQQNRRRPSLKKNNSVVNTELLDIYHSKEFKQSSEPVKVIHPTCDWAPDCYFKTEEIELQEELPQQENN